MVDPDDFGAGAQDEVAEEIELTIIKSEMKMGKTLDIMSFRFEELRDYRPVRFDSVTYSVEKLFLEASNLQMPCPVSRMDETDCRF